MTATVKPWPADTVCPEKDYPAFAEELKQASHHYADDSGKEWGQANLCMERAADTAINAAWPYWAMKRMYREIAPLPSFDSFMEAYCRKLLDTAAMSAKP